MSHRPRRFIATGGDLLGEYQYSTECPDLFEPYDPMTITTASSTLNRPIRLRYIAEDMEATRPIRIIASPVVPGKAGPAQEPPSDPAHG